MVAVLQVPPRVRLPATSRPRRSAPTRSRLRRFPTTCFQTLLFLHSVAPERVLVVHRQPSPRVTRSKRAVYWRRRLVATSLGLGIVLTAAHAGAALGGTTTTPRAQPACTPYVARQPGDTLWSIARAARAERRSASKSSTRGAASGGVRPAARRVDFGRRCRDVRGEQSDGVCASGQLTRGELGRCQLG